MSIKASELRAEAVAAVEREIDALINIAARVDLIIPHIENWEGVKRRLKDDVFNILCTGITRAGKSTLLNALLGRPEVEIPGLAQREHRPGRKAQGILPVTRDATTPCLIWLTYEDPRQPTPGRPPVAYVVVSERVQTEKNKDIVWDLEKFWSFALIDNEDPAKHRERYANILDFWICAPYAILRNVRLVDSPGQRENEDREQEVQQAYKVMDAGMVVINSDFHKDLLDTRKIVADIFDAHLKPPFVVVNLWDEREVDESLKRQIWQRFLSDRINEYSEEALREHHFYFVDAQTAYLARRDGDRARERASGILELEQALSTYLGRERLTSKIDKRVHEAAEIAGGPQGLLADITNREKNLRGDLEKTLAELEAALAKLKEIETKLNALPGLFARHEPTIQAALKVELARILEVVRKRLPVHLKTQTLRSLSREDYTSTLNMFRVKQLSVEASNLVEKYIRGQMYAWAQSPKEEPGLAQALENRLTTLRRDLEAWIADIRRDFEAIKTSPPNLQGFIQDLKRILDKLELEMGDVAGGVLAVGGLVSGIAWVITHTVVGALILKAGGVSLLGPIGIAAVLIGATTVVPRWINRKVLTKAGKAADAELSKAVAALRPDGRAGRGSIAQVAEQQLSAFFKAILADIDKVVRTLLDKRRREILHLIHVLNGRTAAIQQELEKLERARTEIGSRLETLETIKVEVRKKVVEALS